MSVHIEANVMDGLRANFLGELLLPKDLGYDEARSIWMDGSFAVRRSSPVAWG
jgi:hypothetical protein